MPSKVFSRTGASQPSSVDLETGALRGGRTQGALDASPQGALDAEALPEESRLTRQF